MDKYEHSTGTFIGMGANQIFFQKWTVPSPKAIVIIAHGLGEHSGRYNNLIEKMSSKNISFYAIDHSGHGNSDGIKGHIDSFNDYIKDLKLFLNLIRDRVEKVPVFLLGHSMGGVIACRFAINHPGEIEGLILSSAAFTTEEVISPFKQKLVRVLSKYMPKYSDSNGLDAQDISSDEDTIDAYENDPLVHDRISARLYTELKSAAKDCLNRAYDLRIPLLIFHGKGDKIVSFKGSQKFYNDSPSRDKELKLFDDLRHETMNETKSERAKVLSLVSGWITKHISSAKPASKPKPAAKPKTATKKKAAVKPKTVVKKKAAAKPKVAAKPKTAAKKKTAVKAKSTAKKKTAKSTKKSPDKK